MRLALVALALAAATPALAAEQPWDPQAPTMDQQSVNARLREIVDAQQMRVRQLEAVTADAAAARISLFESRNAARLVPTAASVASVDAYRHTDR
jgi:hypothetical protein